MQRSMQSLSPTRSRWASALGLAWFLILIAPAALTLSAPDSWDLEPRQLLLASAWSLVCLRLVLPPRAFVFVTYPVALFGLACIGADLLRDVNLLELAAEWNTFSRSDLVSALAPYRGRLLALALVLGVVGWIVARCESGHRYTARRRHLAAVAGTAVLALLLPSATWPRAWPINAALVGAAYAADSPAVAHQSTSVMLASPRPPHTSWGGLRAAAPAARQTMVLAIGESLRSDYLRECNGPAAVRAVHAGALVACDVTAGADATHASVPLLVSREWPGHGVRVSDDATFQRAFQEAGFHTWWFGTHGAAIAWPDAETQVYPQGSDAEALLPLLDGVLASGDAAASVVLHGYGSHVPYCDRFDAKTAPLAARCPLPAAEPTRADIARWKTAYTDAVDASVGFVNQVIDRLERAPGEAFLVFTPDHGENLLDDDRELFGHALRHPTVWDSHVPVVFWANAAWKAAHRAEWAQLEANARRPLMHADVVPTLLAAGQVRYRERNRPAVDLLQQVVPVRQRMVQTAIGRATSWDQLVFEASEHGRAATMAQAGVHDALAPASGR
jgi:hypothetical protein